MNSVPNSYPKHKNPPGGASARGGLSTYYHILLPFSTAFLARSSSLCRSHHNLSYPGTHFPHPAQTNTPAHRPGSAWAAWQLCIGRVLRTSCRLHHRLNGEDVLGPENPRRPPVKITCSHDTILDGDDADPTPAESTISVLVDDVDGAADVFVHKENTPNMCLGIL